MHAHAMKSNQAILYQEGDSQLQLDPTKTFKPKICPCLDMFTVSLHTKVSQEVLHLSTHFTEN